MDHSYHLNQRQQVVRKCTEEPEDIHDYWYWSDRVLNPMVTSALLI